MTTLRIQFTPVNGSVHDSSSFDCPDLLAWVMVTTMLSVPATRSMAPPMPLTSLPGIIHDAMLPF